MAIISPATGQTNSDLVLQKGQPYGICELDINAKVPAYRLDSAGELNWSGTFNPPSLADGAGSTLTATVTGAAFGDFVLVSAPYFLQSITVTAYVSSANTIHIRLQNETGGTIDLASDTWNVRVIKL